MPKDDPLNFQDKKKYTDRLKAARKLTGQDDAVLIAKGKVQNIDIVAGSQDFRFIGGHLVQHLVKLLLLELNMLLKIIFLIFFLVVLVANE